MLLRCKALPWLQPSKCCRFSVCLASPELSPNIPADSLCLLAVSSEMPRATQSLLRPAFPQSSQTPRSCHCQLPLTPPQSLNPASLGPIHFALPTSPAPSQAWNLKTASCLLSLHPACPFPVIFPVAGEFCF